MQNFVYKKILSVDVFGQPIKWLLPGNKAVQKSLQGALCTIFIYGLLTTYALNRVGALINRDDYNILQEDQNYFFPETYRVSAKDGFRVAAAVTAYGDYTDNEDPSIGTLEFYLKSWLDDGSPLKFRKLKTRQCNLEEFSFQSDKEERDTPFWTIHTNSESYKPYLPTLKCIDEDFELFGDFDTNVAQNLMIVFDKCDPKVRSCADDAVIDEWLKFKYILSVENEEIYLQSRPLGERYEKFAKISWSALVSDTRSDKVKKITF